MKALKNYIAEWDSIHKKLLENTGLLLIVQEKIKILKSEIKLAKSKDLKKQKIDLLRNFQEEEKRYICGQTNETGWDFPLKKLGNTNPTFRYFPEPYYLINTNKNIDIVFVNINPACRFRGILTHPFRFNLTHVFLRKLTHPLV